MAEVAADLLLSVVAGKNTPTWPDPMPRRELDYELVVRQSTAPVAEASVAPSKPRKASR